MESCKNCERIGDVSKPKTRNIISLNHVYNGEEKLTKQQDVPFELAFLGRRAKLSV